MVGCADKAVVKTGFYLDLMIFQVKLKIAIQSKSFTRALVNERMTTTCAETFGKKQNHADSCEMLIGSFGAKLPTKFSASNKKMSSLGAAVVRMHNFALISPTTSGL